MERQSLPHPQVVAAAREFLLLPLGLHNEGPFSFPGEPKMSDQCLAVSIDFETTNKDPMKAAPVEVSAVSSNGRNFTTFIKPSAPIPPETSAIHHITDDDVSQYVNWAGVWKGLNQFITLQYEAAQQVGIPLILVAHNAEYERTILQDSKFDVPHEWVCTYKVALYTYATLPYFSNEYLRYALGLSKLGRRYVHQTHSAHHDATVTLELFWHLLARMDSSEPGLPSAGGLQKMIDLTKEMPKLPVCPMGKHRGTSWDKIPTSYLQWICREQDMNPAVKNCAALELNNRNKGRR